jgi:hypothetical protein
MLGYFVPYVHLVSWMLHYVINEEDVTSNWNIIRKMAIIKTGFLR